MDKEEPKDPSDIEDPNSDSHFDEEEGHLIEDHLEEESGSGHRRKRRKIKIRKRVKIKRKSSPKKKVRSLVQTISWIVIVAAFLITLIILVLQLDFSSKSRKSRSVSAEPLRMHKIDQRTTLTRVVALLNDSHFSNFDA